MLEIATRKIGQRTCQERHPIYFNSFVEVTLRQGADRQRRGAAFETGSMLRFQVKLKYLNWLFFVTYNLDTNSIVFIPLCCQWIVDHFPELLFHLQPR